MKLWIAREKSGTLFLYRSMPIKDTYIFKAISPYDYWLLPRELFPEVTFENSPQKVELVITK